MISILFERILKYFRPQTGKLTEHVRTLSGSLNFSLSLACINTESKF